MKPKQRDTQAQSSRMHLRHREHRDAIFNPGNGLAYHYAMYVNKDKVVDEKGNIKEEAINDYVWIKTPHNYFLLWGRSIFDELSFRPSAYSHLNESFGWMDIDREFQSINPCQWTSGDLSSAKWFPIKASIPRTNIILFKSSNIFLQVGFHTIAVLIERASSSGSGLRSLSDFKYTDDGIIWKNFGIKNSAGNELYMPNGLPRPIGSNGFLVGDYYASGGIGYETGYRNLYITYITSDNPFIGFRIDISLPSISNTKYIYLCPTQTGCIIKAITSINAGQDEGYNAVFIYNTTYFHVTSNGSYSIVQETDNIYGQAVESTTDGITSNFGVLDYICRGNYSGYLHYYRVSQYDNGTSQVRYSDFFIARITNDNGVSWNSEILLQFSQLGGDYYIPDAKGLMFYAQGKFYVLLSTSLSSPDYYSYQVKMFCSSTGESWEEIILPKWVDLPIITENAGLGIDTVASEKLRIAVIPSETPEADCSLHNMYGNKLYRFKDGEPDFTYELFGLYLTDGLHNAYIDNRQLVANSKSFAWITQGTTIPDDFGTYADKVQRYDFCVPPGGFEGEQADPELEYVYYVWDATNNKFIAVDRHLSTYEHYTIVYVEELPETGQLMTLYGVKTDINQNPLYDYFIWENNDFIQIKNIESYTHYTLVRVSALPSSGNSNIIYAISKNTDSFSSNMYIWNPDAVRYEEDPETGHIIEIHGAFEDINTTEYDMTGKNFVSVNVKKLPEKGREGIIYISETKITSTVGSDVENNYNYYMWDNNNHKWILITPVMSYNNIYVMTITNLNPPPSGMNFDSTTFRILKKNDTGVTNPTFESQEDVKKYLERRTDKWDHWITDKNQMPFIGSSGIFYILENEQDMISGTGSYTLYTWDDIAMEYKEGDTYKYYIPESGKPEPKDLMKLVIDVVQSTASNN